MTNVGTKGKLQAKRKANSRKADWSKALMTIRKLKKSAEQGHDDAVVVVGKNMVIVRRKSVPNSTAKVQKVLENYAATQARIQPKVIDQRMASHYEEVSGAYRLLSEQAKVNELLDAYKIHRENDLGHDFKLGYKILKDRSEAENLVNAYHAHVEKAKHKELINAYNQQVRQHVENYHSDRERFVRTLKESPSDEALAFYSSIAGRGA